MSDPTSDPIGDSVGDNACVQAAFTASYQAVPQEAAKRLYRLVSIHPGTDFDTHLAAAAAQVDYSEAAHLLDILIGVNLLEETPDGHCRFDDLARLHARALAAETEQAQGCRQAFANIADHLLRTTVGASLVLDPGQWRLGRYFQEGHRAKPPLSFTDRIDALEWLETEHRNLLDVAKQAHAWKMHPIAWEIAEAMGPLFTHRTLYATSLDTHQLGLQAAQAFGDLNAQALMITGLGATYLQLHEVHRAADHARRALHLTRQSGHQLGQTSALELLGQATTAQGHPDEAITHFSDAREIHRKLRRARGAALMTRHLAHTHAAAGRHGQATDLFGEALDYFNQADEPYQRAQTLSGLADTHLHAAEQRLDEAARALHASLAISRRISSPHQQAGVLVALGRLAHLRGDHATWRSNLQQALSIYTSLDAPEAAQIAGRLKESAPQ